jgi:hypothetical protein
MKNRELGSARNIIIKYNFIDGEQLSSIQNKIHSLEDSSWTRTRVNYELSREIGVGGILDSDAINDSICKVASYEYGANLVPHGSNGNVHLWKKDDYLQCHSDAESEHCVPQPAHESINSYWPPLLIQISALIYLNNDYAGGKLKFTYHGITIDPEPGMLILFPSTCMYPHEVLPVESGMRYTYNIFLSSKSLVDSFIELRNLVK